MALILQAHCINDAVYLNAYKLHILIACLFYFSATIQILLSGDCWWAERSAKLRPLRWVAWLCLRQHHSRSIYHVFCLDITTKFAVHAWVTFCWQAPLYVLCSFPVGRTTHRSAVCVSSLNLWLLWCQIVECPALLLANGAIAKRPQFKRGY